VVLDIERFAVAPGSGVAIVGPNGSGKSTLLRLLALLERPSEGEVRLDGVPVAGAGPRRRITLVEQRPVLLRGTVRENLAFGLQVRGIRRTEVNRRVDSVAGRLGITPLLHRRRHELSDGEVQRVAVARALAVEPDVLLLDEPASSADRAAAQTLYRALAEERARRHSPSASPRISWRTHTAGRMTCAPSRKAGCHRSPRRTCSAWTCPSVQAAAI